MGLGRDSNAKSRRPPIRGYLGVAGKSLVASECVVETRGLELRAWHAVTSNESLTQLNRTGPANFPPSVQRALFLRKHRGIAPDQSLRAFSRLADRKGIPKAADLWILDVG